MTRLAKGSGGVALAGLLLCGTALASERVTLPGTFCQPKNYNVDVDYYAQGLGVAGQLDVFCPLLTLSDDADITDVDVYTGGISNSSHIGIYVVDRDGDYIDFHQPDSTTINSDGEHHDWASISIPNQGTAVVWVLPGTGDEIRTYSYYDRGISY